MTGAERASNDLFIYSLLAAVMTLAAWCHGVLFDRFDLAFNIIIPASFLGLGVLIKYGDQAYDADVYSKRNTLILALPGGIWLGSLMSVDPGSATIFAGMLFALLLAGKLDNLPFKVGFGVALSIFAASLALGIGGVEVIGALAVLVFAFIDEKANDLPGVDNGQGWKAMLLHNRPFLKLAVLGLCLVGILPSLMYFFAFSLRRGVPSLG